jgi:integrase
LKKVPRLKDCPYVFPASRTGQPMSNMAMLTLIARMGLKGAATTHGFRSAFRSWAGDRGYPRDVLEKALAHKEKDETVEAYLRTDFLERRRPIMVAWAEYVTKPPVKGAKVVPLREAV